MRELKLRYFIDLASNIGVKARQDAATLQEAQKIMQGAITGTNTKLTDWRVLSDKASKSTGQLQEVLTGTANKFVAAGRAATQVNTAIGQVDRTTSRASATIAIAADKTAGLDRALTRLGSNTSTERQITYMSRLAASIDAVQTRALRMRQALARGVDRAPEVAATALGGYEAGKRVAAPFMGAYSTLESATTDLRISMTDKDGKVSGDFDKISREAVELGNQLPGSTKDFMRAARGLQVQGVPSSVVANGGLRASSYVGALLEMNQEQAAETIAKLREAHGLKENELVPAADLVQRAYFGFGIKPQDYLETAKYSADTYNAMGITGIDKTRETLAIQGMAANVGLEGSSFGTNYAQMLRRLGQMDSRLNKKSTEAKEAKALLGEFGIDMQFFDKKGVFMGNQNMLEQLSKLRALNPLQQQHVTNRLFGVEASRPAQILISKGLEGYNAARATIEGQANLDQRIEIKMQTFASKLESLAGTIENAQAQIARQLGEAAKPVMDGANSFIGGAAQDFLTKHPVLSTAGLLGATGLGVYLGGRVGGGLLKSLILRGAPAAGPVAGGAAEAGAAGGAASAGAAASSSSRWAMAGRALKYGAPLAIAGAGLQAIGVLSDPESDKARDLSRIGVTAGGGLAGAAAGAALGSVVPGLGTAIGALIGGLLGSLGGSTGAGSLFDMMWAKKDPAARQAGLYSGVPQNEISSKFMSGLAVPQMDLLTLTGPGAGPTSMQAGRTTELKVGEGRIELAVTVRDERISVAPVVTRQPSLIRIDAGNTNPGSIGR